MTNEKQPLAYLLEYELENPNTLYYNPKVPDSFEYGFNIISVLLFHTPRKMWVNQYESFRAFDVAEHWTKWTEDVSIKEYLLTKSYSPDGKFTGFLAHSVEDMVHWDAKVKFKGKELINVTLPKAD